MNCLRPTCVIDGCGGTPVARGWCAPHYARWKRHGNPLHSRHALPRHVLVRLRAREGVGPDGPTPEQVERWRRDEARGVVA